MTRFSRTAVVLGIVLTASAALAQPPEGRGGPRGRGFGRGGPGNGAMLLGIPAVREELKVTDEQAQELDKLRESLRGSGNLREQFQGLRDLEPEQRRARMQELREKAETAARETQEKLGSILNAEQMKRLEQLRLQREGVFALARPEVAKQLELTEEQQTKLREIRRGNQSGERRNIRDLSDEERQKLFAERRAQREKTEAEILAVLTDEQNAKWTEMKGPEFNFPRGQGRRVQQ